MLFCMITSVCYLNLCGCACVFHGGKREAENSRSKTEKGKSVNWMSTVESSGALSSSSNTSLLLFRSALDF